LVVAVMKWLATRMDATDTLSPQPVLKGLRDFRRELRTFEEPGGIGPHGLT